jgi:hypothetical protein
MEFNAIHSAWSGVVTFLEVGYPFHNLKLALDTQTSLTILWDEQACPAFVDSGCFLKSESRTLQPGWSEVFTFSGQALGPLQFTIART